jgi:CspA family cold shock protein
MKGAIKKLVLERGFGFIKPDDGGADVFFHCTALPEKSQFDGLKEGQRVEFDQVEGKEGKPKGVNVAVM